MGLPANMVVKARKCGCSSSNTRIYYQNWDISNQLLSHYTPNAAWFSPFHHTNYHFALGLTFLTQSYIANLGNICEQVARHIWTPKRSTWSKAKRLTVVIRVPTLENMIEPWHNLKPFLFMMSSPNTYFKAVLFCYLHIQSCFSLKPFGPRKTAPQYPDSR